MIPTGQSLVGLDFLGIYRQTKGTSVLGLKRSGGINHPGGVKNISEKSCQEMVGFGLYV